MFGLHNGPACIFDGDLNYGTHEVGGSRSWGWGVIKESYGACAEPPPSSNSVLKLFEVNISFSCVCARAKGSCVSSFLTRIDSLILFFSDKICIVPTSHASSAVGVD